MQFDNGPLGYLKARAIANDILFPFLVSTDPHGFIDRQSPKVRITHIHSGHSLAIARQNHRLPSSVFAGACA